MNTMSEYVARTSCERYPNGDDGVARYFARAWADAADGGVCNVNCGWGETPEKAASEATALYRKNAYLYGLKGE